SQAAYNRCWPGPRRFLHWHLGHVVAGVVDDVGVVAGPAPHLVGATAAVNAVIAAQAEDEIVLARSGQALSRSGTIDSDGVGGGVPEHEAHAGEVHARYGVDDERVGAQAGLNCHNCAGTDLIARERRSRVEAKRKCLDARERYDAEINVDAIAG